MLINLLQFIPLFCRCTTALTIRNARYIGDLLAVFLPMHILTTNRALELDNLDEFTQIRWPILFKIIELFNIYLV